MNSQIEENMQVENPQMRDTRQVVISALSEVDQYYDIKENKLLKENWISEAIAKLQQPIPNETAAIVSHSDAQLATQNERGFVSAYLSHLGSPLHVEDLKDFYNGKKTLKTLKGDELDVPLEPRIVWVEDASGRKKLVTSTKIDGLQLMLDTDKVGNGPETTGAIHPILLLSTK